MMTSLTKKRNGRPPAPPPRYTSPPTVQQQQRSGTPPSAEQDMPLVSNASFSSLPIFMELKHQRNRDSDSTPSPEGPYGNGRRRKARNKRETDLMETYWASAPDQLSQQQQQHQQHVYQQPQPLSRQQTLDWDIHEKRKVLMGRMKQFKTEGRGVVQSFDSNQTNSSSTVSVPADLLEKRRVLMKTLHRVQSVTGSANVEMGSPQGSSPTLNRTQSQQWGSASSAMGGRARLTSQSSTESTSRRVSPKRRELPMTPTKPSSIQQFLLEGGGQAGIVRQHSLVVVDNSSNPLGERQLAKGRAQPAFLRSQSMDQQQQQHGHSIGPSLPTVLKGGSGGMGMFKKSGLSVIHSASTETSNESVV